MTASGVEVTDCNHCLVRANHSTNRDCRMEFAGADCLSIQNYKQKLSIRRKHDFVFLFLFSFKERSGVAWPFILPNSDRNIVVRYPY